MSTSDERPPSGPAGAGNEAATPASDAEEARRPVEVFRFALGETLLAFPVEALERVMAEQTPTPLPIFSTNWRHLDTQLDLPSD